VTILKFGGLLKYHAPMNAKDVERQLEITKELSELLAQQLHAMEDEAFLGRNDSDDVSHKRSLRIRELRRELATIAARE